MPPPDATAAVEDEDPLNDQEGVPDRKKPVNKNRRGKEKAKTPNPRDGSVKVDEACRLFAAGKCKWGNRCRYRHDLLNPDGGDKDSKPTTLEPPGGSNRPPRRQNPASKNCFAWERKGSCLKGDKCPYKHMSYQEQQQLTEEERFRIGERKRAAIRRQHELESADYEERAAERDIDFLSKVMEGKLTISDSAWVGLVSGTAKMR
ncbi:hypothetical protein R3P38DRAFT_1183808 [Favolaschia claudopus]|uniref:C3H1-type domain-containing protein n=1 Tax=Favolaschia claudopus TaxID=2862362 RepID=A0AAW0E473_9AGAR